MSRWEAVIGLEVHARLMTRTKIFCRCENAAGAAPNSHVCPICLGYPGALPVLNRQAVHLALRAAVALGCTVDRHSVFARKNYFYPDLPKGYQISQYDRPLGVNGRIPILVDGSTKNIRIHRIHIEEDAGKSMHQFPFDDVPGDVSLVDLNRAGAPLVEIVSEPDLSSSAEADRYLTRLRQILMYAEVCDGNMEDGSLRCDANVSVRRPGEALNTRVEIKNLNSFRFLGRAIDYEIERQIELHERGEQVSQETRLFDVAAGITRAMRSKEEAHDYRYFPEPDLPVLSIDEEWVERAREELPPLPAERIERYVDDFGVPRDDADVLVTSRELAEYFEATLLLAGNARLTTNWVRNEVLGYINDKKVDLGQLPLRPAALASLIRLIDGGVINGKVAKELFEEIAVSGEMPDALVEQRGLVQITDPDELRAAADRVLARSTSQLDAYRGGKTQLFGFFVGQVMKETGGKAKPELVNELLRALLDT